MKYFSFFFCAFVCLFVCFLFRFSLFLVFFSVLFFAQSSVFICDTVKFFHNNCKADLYVPFGSWLFPAREFLVQSDICPTALEKEPHSTPRIGIGFSTNLSYGRQIFKQILRFGGWNKLVLS